MKHTQYPTTPSLLEVGRHKWICNHHPPLLFSLLDPKGEFKPREDPDENRFSTSPCVS